MQDKGQQVVDFVNCLTHTKGKWAGKPFNLRPWQERFVRKVYGTLKPDGRRQYRTAFLFCARKNGKTTLASSLALWMLLGDGENAARVYSAASTRDQAALVFGSAAQQVRNNDQLRRVCRIIDSQKKIIYEPTDSFYQAVSAEAGTKHGIDASCIILDEVHTFGADRELFDVLRTSVGAREQPLEILITTAGNNDADALEFELFNYAKQIEDGTIEDDSFFADLYYAPNEADWRLEETWHMANPGLGDFRSLEEMQRMCEEAQRVVSRQNAFRRLYLNQHTEAEEAWLSVNDWDTCRSDDWPDLRGVDCWGGLDLASTADLCAFTLVWPYEGRFYTRQWFWAPVAADERREIRNMARYKPWQIEGYISLVPDNAVDHVEVLREIQGICKQYAVREVAIDQNFGGRQAGLTAERMGLWPVLFPMQIRALSPGCKKLEELISTKRIVHDGNKCMRWNIANAVAWRDNNENIRPDKKKSIDKIDGVMALVMALSRIDATCVDSIYCDDGRGLLSV